MSCPDCEKLEAQAAAMRAILGEAIHQNVVERDELLAENKQLSTRMEQYEKALRRLVYCNEVVSHYGEIYKPDLDKAIELAHEAQNREHFGVGMEREAGE